MAMRIFSRFHSLASDESEVLVYSTLLTGLILKIFSPFSFLFFGGDSGCHRSEVLIIE